MRHSPVLAVASAIALMASASISYPRFAPRGPSYPMNTLPPRKDKGIAYYTDANGTRRITGKGLN